MSQNFTVCCLICSMKMVFKIEIFQSNEFVIITHWIFIRCHIELWRDSEMDERIETGKCENVEQKQRKLPMTKNKAKLMLQHIVSHCGDEFSWFTFNLLNKYEFSFSLRIYNLAEWFITTKHWIFPFYFVTINSQKSNLHIVVVYYVESQTFFMCSTFFLLSQVDPT